MDRLFNQTKRNRMKVGLPSLRHYAKNVLGLDFDSMPEERKIELAKVVEYSRRTEFMMDNADRVDEHIVGMAEMISNRSLTIADAIHKIGNQLEFCAENLRR